MTILPTILLAATAVSGCATRSGPQPAVLVELYTSQGCSSCPPADRWLGTLGPRHGDAVLPLSLHVGYWDYIGWKDPFARREFNERQRLLAAANGSRSVYTPGVFVQGRELPDWSKITAFDAAVRAARQQPARARLDLALVETSTTALTVRVAGAAPEGARLWLALTENGLRTAVGAGENRGETLRNDHVVRDWRGPYRVAAITQSLTLPSGAAPDRRDRFSVVALIDDARGQVLQALRLQLANCGMTPR